MSWEDDGLGMEFECGSSHGEVMFVTQIYHREGKESPYVLGVFSDFGLANACADAHLKDKIGYMYITTPFEVDEFADRRTIFGNGKNPINYN